MIPFLALACPPHEQWQAEDKSRPQNRHVTVLENGYNGIELCCRKQRLEQYRKVQMTHVREARGI